MLRFNRSFVILVLAALLAGCGTPAVAPTATPVPPTATPIPPTPTAETTPAPLATEIVSPPKMLYSGDGQYKVGSKDFAVQDGDETLNISAFYPGLNAAAPDIAHGPYPLVVFSPGMSTNPLMYMNWLGPIASRGFVILTSTPRGENYPEFWAGAATRPLDIRRIIDYAGKLTAPDGQLAGLIDTERIGVVGHSSGGWSALMAGGAQMDLGWCAAHPDLVANNTLSNCPQFVSHQQEIAAMLGLKSAPAGIWPPMGDPRVDAVISASPDGDIWGAEYGGVAGVKVPTLIMAGSADSINVPELCAYPIYEHLESAKKTLVVFEQGSHDLGWFVYRNAITHIMTAFLLAELRGEPEAVKALLPQNVAVPGVKYETNAPSATPEPASKLNAATVTKIEALVSEMMARTKLPGFALGIVKDGELVYAKGFGVTNLDGGAPVTPQTVFQWAETSMAPTAMAVLQLVEQGKIDLDAPVTAYLPYFKLADERYKDITVGQILMHRSGIPDSGDAMADWENFTPQYDPSATERWVRSLADKGLLFAPGSGFEYSDLGYALLGDVIAKVRGQSYEETMSENILKPLGMNNSAFLLEEVDKALLAAPHVTNAAGEVVAGKALPYHRPFAAANNLFSSIEDMAKLAQASLNGGVLNGQRILPESAVEQMWTSHTPTSYGDFRFGTAQPARMMIDWGYGWFLGDVAGHRVPNTFGREYGIQTAMALAPDVNLAVIAAGNGPVTGAYYASDTATDVMGMLLEGRKVAD